MREQLPMIPVWFFIGILLLIYGIIISLTGVWQLSRPPATVLANYHVALFWGLSLTAIGATYIFAYWPKKGKQ